VEVAGGGWGEAGGHRDEGLLVGTRDVGRGTKGEGRGTWAASAEGGTRDVFPQTSVYAVWYSVSSYVSAIL